MRIIAGELGGLRLVAPRGLATRPTTDRVREALFSILGAIDGARVLDLYAGTGALGLEALSRGASHATFVESSRPALVCLRENIRELGVADRASVLALTVERALAELVRARGAFTLIFADPPYADALAAAASIEKLAQKGAFAGDAVLVLEHASRDAPPSLPSFASSSSRTYGDTALSIQSLRDLRTPSPS